MTEKENNEMLNKEIAENKEKKTKGKIIVKEVIREKNKFFTFSHLLFTAIVATVVSVISIFIYDKYYAQKIVSFDFKGYILGLRDMYMSGKINDAELKQAIDLVEQKIKSQEKNKVVFMGDVILSKVERIDYPIRIEFNQDNFTLQNQQNNNLPQRQGSNEQRPNK